MVCFILGPEVQYLLPQVTLVFEAIREHPRVVHIPMALAQVRFSSYLILPTCHVAMWN